MEVYVHIVWGKVFTNASEKKKKKKKYQSAPVILSTNTIKRRGCHNTFNHTSIIITVITNNGGLTVCNATTHYTFILLLETHKRCSDRVGSLLHSTLKPSVFKTILHLQQQSLRHMVSTGNTRSEVRLYRLRALGTSGRCLGSWSVLKFKKPRLHCFEHLYESTVNSNAGGFRLAKILLCYL